MLTDAGAMRVLRCFGAICGSALVAAALSAVGVVHVDVDAPHDALRASPSTAFSLVAHNAVVALWPLGLIAMGWPAMRGGGLVGDLLVLAQLISHGYVVGSVAAEQPELWRYLPHLPVEWLALSAPTAAWRAARGGQLTMREAARLAGLCAAALVVAASIETYAVPVA